MAATKRDELDHLYGPREIRSCLGRAAEDEPVFIIRANDRTSSKVVRFWAQVAFEMGCQNEEKLDEAKNWAIAAEKWRDAHDGGKVPD